MWLEADDNPYDGRPELSFTELKRGFPKSGVVCIRVPRLWNLPRCMDTCREDSLKGPERTAEATETAAPTGVCIIQRPVLYLQQVVVFFCESMRLSGLSVSSPLKKNPVQERCKAPNSAAATC